MSNGGSLRRRRIVSVILLALLSLASTFGYSVADSEPAGAASCSNSYLSLHWPVIQGERGGYFLQGSLRVTNTTITDGCKLRVCLHEELSAGHWVAGGCTWNYIARGEPYYYGYRLWAQCSIYEGTGRVRTYARYDGGSIKLGPIRTFNC